MTGLNMMQLNKKAGHNKKFSKLLKSENWIPDDVSDLPKQFSWKHVLDTPREQKDCGSCYIFATLEMLQARLQILYDEEVRLSI